ncbi:MAG: ATP:cob(I)alamin adenosyltransferase [Elusimicrobiota bacterium]
MAKKSGGTKRIFKPAQGSGDGGMTALLSGRRVAKTDPRVKANALIDELSCLLGLVKSGGFEKAALSRAQAALSAAAANIAGMKNGGALSELASDVEKISSDLSRRARPPARFVLPGENPVEATLHLARARARLCEILCWELKAKDPAVLLNRLSDWLFLLALSAGTGRHLSSPCGDCRQSVAGRHSARHLRSRRLVVPPRALRAAGKKKNGRNK